MVPVDLAKELSVPAILVEDPETVKELVLLSLVEELPTSVDLVEEEPMVPVDLE